MNIHDQAYERQTDKALHIVSRAQEIRKRSERCQKTARRLVDHSIGGLLALTLLAILLKSWSDASISALLALAVSLGARIAGIRG